ncbi:MAG: hypothetical protein KKB32_04685 [Acidobacteria bacterium]|nr:hypothetical protein [Acidobacteriota bacterium]
MLLASFALAITAGTLLLLLPLATTGGGISVQDALFTSTSAVCVTGLTVVDTGSRFTPFGQTVILILIKLGGLGIMTFTSLFFFLAGKGLRLRDKLVIDSSFTVEGKLSLKHFVRDIFIFTFCLEIIGAFGLYAAGIGAGTGRRVFIALFHSVSAFNNAGFSTYPDSLSRFSGHVMLNIIVILLIVGGGLGFFVVRDIWYKIGNRKKYKFSLHSKMVVIMTVFLIVGASLLFFLLEKERSLNGLPLTDQVLGSLFQSVTPRTAGFNTANLTLLAPATVLLLLLLMFIGASPGSTGGGIKTTSALTLLLFLKNSLRQRKNIRIWGRNLPNDLIQRVQLIFLSSLFVVLASAFLITLAEGGRFSLTRIFFEVVSAFATVGLSLGITAQLSTFSKFVIIMTMYTGRVGIINIFFTFQKERYLSPYEYPEERIMVG